MDANTANTNCQMCETAAPTVELGFGREVLTTETLWHPVAALGRADLCDQCAVWFGELMQTAANGRGDPQGRLGIPARGPARRNGGNDCDYCQASLRGVAIAVDLVPGSASTQAGRSRHTVAIRHQRLCGYCAAWLQSVVHDPSAMRGASARQAEGPMGVWRSLIGASAATSRLSAMDSMVVATTVEANGFQSIELPVSRMPDALREGYVGFVGPGERSSEQLIQRLPAELSARVAVVAHTDGLEDAVAAMRAGAAEFLASPLSPQQVAGAIDRLLGAAQATGRGPLLGLPKYQGQISDGYGVALPIAIRLLKPEHAAMAALLLRRFIRGYDRVGEDGAGGLRAMVYCPPADLPLVVARLAPLLADYARVSTAP